MAVSDNAVKAAQKAYRECEGDSTESHRAALTAALPFLSVQGAVKKLEWELVSGDHYAEGSGTHYNIYEARPDFWNCVTVKPVNVRLATNVSLEAAKAAAQADYEARILSALEPSAAREQALHEAARNLINELSGNPGELIDKMAEAIRDWGSHYDDGPWETLPEDRKAGWRGDAERALAAVKEYLTTRALSSPDHADAGKVEGDGIERAKFYHHQWPMEKLLEARRDGLVDRSGGEAWRYEYSHKDEHGKYDILYRPLKNSSIRARLPSAPSEGAE